MWRSSQLSSTQFTFLPRRSAASWTPDGKYLFRAKFFLHGRTDSATEPHPGMVTFEHFLPDGNHARENPRLRQAKHAPVSMTGAESFQWSDDSANNAGLQSAHFGGKPQQAFSVLG